MTREILALRAAVLDHLPDAVYVRGADRKILYVNPAAERLTGRSLDEVLSLSCYRAFGDPESRCRKNCPVDRAIATGEPLRHVEGTIEAKDGRPVPVEVTVAPVEDDGTGMTAIVILRDLSRIRALEETQVKALVAAEQVNRELEASEARFRDFASMSCDWLWETDAAHRFTCLTGDTVTDPRLVLGRRREEIFDTKKDPARWRPLFMALAQRSAFSDFVYPMDREDGRRVWVRTSGKPLFDADGTFLGYRGIGHEVTSAVEEREQLHTRATRDHLTKLPNRGAFDEALRTWLTRYAREGNGFAVVFIDLDDFKRINDDGGHDAGDQVLTIAGERLLACSRADDQVARLGGDEFGVLLAGVSREEDAAAIAEKMRDRLAEPMGLSNGETVMSGASVGVAICPVHGREASALVQAADHAMYRAKQDGKGQFRIANVPQPRKHGLALTP